MIRKKRATIASIVFFTLGIVSLVFTIQSGIILFAVATVVLFVISYATRKRISFQEYREEYEQKYFNDDSENTTEKQ